MTWNVTYYGPTWKGPKSLLYSVTIKADTATDAILKAGNYIVNQPGINLSKLNWTTSVEVQRCP